MYMHLNVCAYAFTFVFAYIHKYCMSHTLDDFLLMLRRLVVLFYVSVNFHEGGAETALKGIV